MQQFMFGRTIKATCRTFVRWTLCTTFIVAGMVPLCKAEPADESSADKPKLAVSYGAETDVCSKYLWHGMVWSEDYVVQPTAWLSVSDLTFSLWGNRSPAKTGPGETTDEIDYSLSHSRQWSSLTTDLSLNYYTYPGQEEAPSTGECEAAVSFAAGLFEFGTRQSLDVFEYPGAYWGEAGIAARHSPVSFLELSAETSLGWGSEKFNETYAGVPKQTINGLAGSLSAAFYLSEQVYWKPHFEIFQTLDSEIADVTQRTATNFGALLGVEF